MRVRAPVVAAGRNLSTRCCTSIVGLPETQHSATRLPVRRASNARHTTTPSQTVVATGRSALQSGRVAFALGDEISASDFVTAMPEVEP